ncbi:MAG: hypothetical protein RIC55_36880 [Pirellulaceae bacterium]
MTRTLSAGLQTLAVFPPSLEATLNELLQSVPMPALVGGAIVVVLLIGGLTALVLRSKRRTLSAGEYDSELAIDLLALTADGPPDAWPQLEFYGVPVRLAILVLAPAGRLASIPPKEKLRETVESLMPGLAQVLDRHQPIFRRWPEQMSTQGFAQSFFNKMKLPGQAGKKTPWCSVAGKFDDGDQQLLAGIVCCADSPNALSTVVVEHVGQWRDVLRVRRQP